LGRPIYDLFYGPFAQKAWGLPGNRIAATQAERRVNQRGVLDLARQLSRGGQTATYLYPRLGFGQITDSYADVLRQRPNVEIRCSATIERVELDAQRVAAVCVRSSGGPERVEIEHVVWTAPITTLPALCEPSHDVPLAAAKDLRYRALVIAYVELDVERIGSVDTYYFPDPAVPFNRVAEQRNFSPDTIPGGSTVLVMDLPCDPGDRLFSADDEGLREIVVGALDGAGLSNHAGIRDFWTWRLPHAYPIYDLGFEAPLDHLNTWALTIQNLWLAGRQGLFLHNNTHHSLLMGIEAAETIRAVGSRSRWKELQSTFAGFSVAD
jgi:protoporphyrinogen oxidase